MATLVLTNTVDQPAAKGQAVRVILANNAVSNLASLSVGQKVEMETSNNVGYISEIDSYGVSFLVTPQYPFSDLSGASAGLFKKTETATVTL